MGNLGPAAGRRPKTLARRDRRRCTRSGVQGRGTQRLCQGGNKGTEGRSDPELIGKWNDKQPRLQRCFATNAVDTGLCLNLGSDGANGIDWCTSKEKKSSADNSNHGRPDSPERLRSDSKGPPRAAVATSSNRCRSDCSPDGERVVVQSLGKRFRSRASPRTIL